MCRKETVAGCVEPLRIPFSSLLTLDVSHVSFVSQQASPRASGHHGQGGSQLKVATETPLGKVQSRLDGPKPELLVLVGTAAVAV